MTPVSLNELFEVRPQSRKVLKILNYFVIVFAIVYHLLSWYTGLLEFNRFSLITTLVSVLLSVITAYLFQTEKFSLGVITIFFLFPISVMFKAAYEPMVAIMLCLLSFGITGFLVLQKQKAIYMVCAIGFLGYIESIYFYEVKYNSIFNSQVIPILTLYAIPGLVTYFNLKFLRDSLDSYELDLKAKQKEIEDAQRWIQIQNDDLKAFSIAASHNMQTPIYISKHFFSIIKEKILVKNDDEDLSKQFELVENGLSQIEQLVNGLFSYNTIINIENELTECDIAEEINLIKENIIPIYPRAIIKTNNANRKVRTNKMLLSIIIYNLIDNGLKYNRSLVPEVNVELDIDETKTDLFIRDNGIGIPKEYFNKIFEPFKRISSDLKSTRGNGLGLAGAKRAAEKIGGNLLCVESNESGSIFKLEIFTNKIKLN